MPNENTETVTGQGTTPAVYLSDVTVVAVADLGDLQIFRRLLESALEFSYPPDQHKTITVDQFIKDIADLKLENL